MFRSFILYFLVYFSSASCFASDTLVLKRSIPGNAHLISTDHVGNLYVVRNNNVLVKYNSNGDSLAIFNEVRKGRITHVDATNPLRVLLFFQDFGQVIVLDNMLSRKNIIKLNSIGLFNVTAIAGSVDGNIWCYDADQGNLLKIDDKASIRFQQSLRNMFDRTPSLSYMVEEERVLYAVDTSSGIEKFDLYGYHMASFPFKTHEIQWFNNQFIYFQTPSLVSYNTLSMNERKLELPHPETVQQVRMEREGIYIRREHSVEVYTYEQKR